MWLPSSSDRHPSFGATLIDTFQQPAHLAATADGVVVSDGSDTPLKLWRTDGRLVPLAARLGVPAAMAVAGDTLVWLELRDGTPPSGNCTGNGTVLLVHRTDLTSRRTETLATTDHCGGGTLVPPVAGDNGEIFWLADTVSPPEYRIDSWSPADGGVTTLYRASQAIAGLTRAGNRLYWREVTYSDNGVVKSMPVAGGAADTVATPELPLSAEVAIQGSTLIYATQGFPNARSIIAHDLVNGTETTIFTASEVFSSTPTRVEHLAANSANVFWYEGDRILAAPLAGGEPWVVADHLSETVAVMTTADDDLVWGAATGPAHGQHGAVYCYRTAGGQADILSQCRDAVTGLAVTGNLVYWAEGGPIAAAEGGGRIAVTDLAGTAVATVLAGIATPAPVVAVDDNFAYVADRFRIKRVPLATGALEEVARGDFFIKGLAAGGGMVFFSEDPNGRIRRVAADGGPITDLATGEGPAGVVRYRDGVVSFLDHNDTVGRVDASGGPATILAKNLPLLDDMVVGAGGAVVVAEHDTGVIRRLDEHGTTILTQRSAMSAPFALAEAGGLVYWIDQAEVGRIPLAGGGATLLTGTVASDPYLPGAIAGGPAGIFWSEGASGRVWSTISLADAAGPWFPLVPGRTWTYRDQHGNTSTTTVSATPKIINGVPTFELVDTDGSRQYYTNDSDGIRLHRLLDPTESVSGRHPAEITFSPPLPLAAPQAVSGQVVAASGTAELVEGSIRVAALSYQSESLLKGFETVTTPLVRGKTALVQTTVHLKLGNLDLPTLLFENWLGRDIGPLRLRADTDDLLLTATNQPLADLELRLAGPLLPPVEGRDFALVLAVANRGPDPAKNITVRLASIPGWMFHDLPAGCTMDPELTCVAGTDLAEGATRTWRLTVTAAPGAEVVSGAVSASTVDPYPDDNHARLQLAVTAIPYGDLDGDGVATLADAILGLRILAGHNGTLRPDFPVFPADTNGDGVLSSGDLVTLLQRLASGPW